MSTITFELQLTMALLLDQLFGDPRWFPHPVRIIGGFALCCEKLFRNIYHSALLAGLAAVVAVLMVTVSVTIFLLWAVSLYSLLASQLLAIFLLYTTVAGRDLVRHSTEVYKRLQQEEDLDPARQAVAMIVGRDTSNLDQGGIVRACVETVAENMVDGVTAPLFYAVVLTLFAPLTGLDPLFLSVCGAMGYKAINTMDSLFGYKNERYLAFGNTAARLDDLVNFIPARLSGLILIPATLLLKLDSRRAWRVFKRDRLCHASPNGGHPEAVFAGALGIQLGGESSYFGRKTPKPLLGDQIRKITIVDIIRSNHLMLLGSLFFVVVMLVLRQLLLSIII